MRIPRKIELITFVCLASCAAPNPPDSDGSRIVKVGTRIRTTDTSCPVVPANLLVNPRPPDDPYPLKPVKRVAPSYPDCGDQRQIGGVVDLEFTVQPDGSVADIIVTQEVPSGFGFAEAFIHAFKQWQYQPVFVNGVAIAAKGHTRMTFNFSKQAG